MKFWQVVKPRLFKVTLTIVVTLLLVQYWRHIAADTHRFLSVYGIDSSKLKMRFLSDSSENITKYDDVEEYTNSSSQNSSVTEMDKFNNEITLCPPVPPNLVGPIDVDMEIRSNECLAEELGEIDVGGQFRPTNCKARHVVALVIPYRNRPQQLSIFLYNIHNLLMKQQIDYGIYVVEQEGTGPFNRGKLMNVGFVEASKIRQYDCYIFHDVDLVPEDDRNLYTCPEQPRHMSVAVDKFNYKLPYNEIFGGVCALTKEHFQMTNGFSNSFWGWGAEDDDMYSRVKRAGLHVSRYPPTIARYTMLPHSEQPPNPKRYEVLNKVKKLYKKDGLKNLDYERKAIEFRRLYTWILADLHPPR